MHPKSHHYNNLILHAPISCSVLLVCMLFRVSRSFDEAGVCQLGGLFLSPLQNSFP